MNHCHVVSLLCMHSLSLTRIYFVSPWYFVFCLGAIQVGGPNISSSRRQPYSSAASSSLQELISAARTSSSVIGRAAMGLQIIWRYNLREHSSGLHGKQQPHSCARSHTHARTPRENHMTGNPSLCAQSIHDKATNCLRVACCGWNPSFRGEILRSSLKAMNHKNVTNAVWHGFLGLINECSYSHAGKSHADRFEESLFRFGAAKRRRRRRKTLFMHLLPLSAWTQSDVSSPQVNPWILFKSRDAWQNKNEWIV